MHDTQGADSDEGGETHFPDLNLTVAPATGRALLWPSLMDADVRSTELFTFHESLPVVRGVKYIANSWIHQFDFQTPRTLKRCELSSFAVGSVDPRWETCRHLPEDRKPIGRCVESVPPVL